MTPLPSLSSLPSQPAGTSWPTRDWPLGDIPASADRARLRRLVDRAFAPAPPDDLEQTDALVVVRQGRLILERYAAGRAATDTFKSWSMAKSITQALVGLLVKDGRIDIQAPAAVPEWRRPRDPRGAITLDHLLRMASGLAFVEDYVPGRPSDVREMLWGAGRGDTAHFAAGFPLAHAPGTVWSYSSGGTNIVARAASLAAEASGADFRAFMRARLFEPLGMATPIPKFDAAGTFIGSSYCFASARDFARFGLLYLRGGVWDGARLLPDGWVDYARTPAMPQPAEGARYGAHWWLGLAGPDSFSANGHEGQFTVVIPSRDMVIVRHGTTDEPKLPNVKRWIADIAACFAPL